MKSRVSAIPQRLLGEQNRKCLPLRALLTAIPDRSGPFQAPDRAEAVPVVPGNNLILALILAIVVRPHQELRPFPAQLALLAGRLVIDVSNGIVLPIWITD